MADPNRVNREEVDAWLATPTKLWPDLLHDRAAPQSEREYALRVTVRALAQARGVLPRVDLEIHDSRPVWDASGCLVGWDSRRRGRFLTTGDAWCNLQAFHAADVHR
jgi:hypothetical protein